METLIGLAFATVGCFVVKALWSNGERSKKQDAVFISSCYRTKSLRQCRSEFDANRAMRDCMVKGWN